MSEGLFPGLASINGKPEGQSPVTALTNADGVGDLRRRAVQAAAARGLLPGLVAATVPARPLGSRLGPFHRGRTLADLTEYCGQTRYPVCVLPDGAPGLLPIRLPPSVRAGFCSISTRGRHRCSVFDSCPLHGRSPSRSSLQRKSRGATVLAAVALLSSMLTILPAQVSWRRRRARRLLNAPTNGATGIGHVADARRRRLRSGHRPLTVTYFGRPLASGNFAQIAQHTGVASGANDTASWASLGAGQTFEWYATVSDGTDTTTGPTWTFHTTAERRPGLRRGRGHRLVHRHGRQRHAATSSRASTATSSRSATTSTRTAPPPTSRTATHHAVGEPRCKSRGRGRSRATTTGAPDGPDNLNGYNGYFGADRHRRQRQELLQLRHPRQQLAHRQPRQRVRSTCPAAAPPARPRSSG